MYATLGIDVFLIGCKGVGPEAATYRAGFDQGDKDSAADQFQTQGVRKTLQGKLARVVSAAKRQRHEAEQRAYVYDASLALRTHYGQQGI